MYAAPFFGWDSLRTKLEFKGVVTVTMDLQTLDINQCPGKYHAPNAFKDTHKCDRKTSYVSTRLEILSDDVLKCEAHEEPGCNVVTHL